MAGEDDSVAVVGDVDFEPVGEVDLAVGGGAVEVRLVVDRKKGFCGGFFVDVR